MVDETLEKIQIVLYLNILTRGRRNEESTTVAIFNLYYKTDEEELRRIFERYGKIDVSY